MSHDVRRRLVEIARSTPYSECAFAFVDRGLSYAVRRVHGEETEAHRALAEYITERDLDWDDLIAQFHTGELPEPLRDAIEAAGGCDRLNRHISGRELCWGLRDFALKRWGMMARPVLESWNVRETVDFGRIVFTFIENDLMQKQPGDALEDFEDVYKFSEAFDEAFRRVLKLGPECDKRERHGDADGPLPCP